MTWRRRHLGAALVVSSITALAAALLLRDHLLPGEEAPAPLPNVDFYMMAVATRPIDAIEAGSTSVSRIQVGQRCVLGYASCSGTLRSVEAQCLDDMRTVRISERDWPALQRIVHEDLPGAVNVPANMDLCSSISSPAAAQSERSAP